MLGAPRARLRRDLPRAAAGRPGRPALGLQAAPAVPVRRRGRATTRPPRPVPRRAATRGASTWSTPRSAQVAPRRRTRSPSYCVQPVLPAGSHRHRRRARDEPTGRRRVLGGHRRARLRRRRCDRVGFDAQLSNWAVRRRPAHLLRRHHAAASPGRRPRGARHRRVPRLVPLAAASHPCGASSSPTSSSATTGPARSSLDLAANLVKERLEQHIPTVLAAAGDRVDAAPHRGRGARPTTAATPAPGRHSRPLRRADRAWQRRVRRRPYPFLLPSRSSS